MRKSRLHAAAALASAAALACLALLAGACTRGTGFRRELTVLAASSLAGVLPDAGARFEDAHPGVSVRFSFGPSDGLLAQIRRGAPADVFCSASERWMDEAARNPGIEDRTVFAQNSLAIAVPPSNPAGVWAVQDLARKGVKVVLAAPGVPIGDYAREMLARAGIERATLANVVSNELDDQAVIAKIASGSADAGVVYGTDFTPDLAGRIRRIEIPAAVNVTATYSAAVVAGSKNSDVARELVDFLAGPARSIFTRAGFIPPE